MTTLSQRLATLAFALLMTLASVARADNPLKIAVLSSGSANDGGWNQLAADALKKVQSDLHAKGKFMEKVPADQAADRMRDFITSDYDLVIGHGYEFFAPAREAAKDSGKTKFAVSGSADLDPNVAALDFDLSQACYQIGIIAAKVSKTGKIGFIGGERIPSLESCYRGLVAGARSVNPKIVVLEAYTSWDKPEISKSQTETYIHQGVDVVFQDVDSASRGVLEAVKEANAKKTTGLVYTFGSNSDQNNNTDAGDYTLASAVIKLDQAFAEVAKSVKEGTFKPGVKTENLANGICVTVVNPKLKPAIITPEIEDSIAAAAKKFVAGDLRVPATLP